VEKAGPVGFDPTTSGCLQKQRMFRRQALYPC
jgi:hypothetical protein